MHMERSDTRYRIQFEHMPPRATRARLKNIGFTWSASKRAWFGDITDEAESFAHQLALDGATNTVTCANCLQFLPTLPDACIDLALTDPPYVVGYKDRTGRSIQNDRNTDWIAPAFKQIHRVLKPDSFCISFYGWNRIDHFMSAWKAAGFTPVGHIVFVKTYPSSKRFLGYYHECAYLLAKGRPEKPRNPLPDVLDWTYSGNQHHPTQKSVDVLEPLINSFTRPGQLVLDPFAGSASTAIAARNLDRNFIAVEKDEFFHQIAVKRLTREGERS